MKINIFKVPVGTASTPEIIRYEQYVDEAYTVVYLKFKLNIGQGPEFRTTVMHGQKRLKDDDVLRDVGLTNEGTINVKIEKLLLGGGLSTSTIIVLTNNGERVIPGVLDSSKQIGQLKSVMAERFDVTPEMLRFMYNGSERADHEIIKELGILEDDLKNYILCFGPCFEDFRLVEYTLELKRK